jgi:hypothetical protein
MIEDILLQEFGSIDIQYQDIRDGGGTSVFKVQFDGLDYVLRIRGEEPNPIVNNFRSLRHLTSLDIAPQAIRCNQWDNVYYSIETFLPGEHQPVSDQ